ncbi:chemotaxis protein CheW [Leptospira andrefontaineae]|uniref:Chemotaxis protein CheW n=1 Tax=Leptospira andrefontaineae TaxID=2484976 RepID=A0A4V6QKZ8_9LEPT|nr:chemotaxis protein CheW [Leptospira andrefontaineae]TGK39060.1 chemotaxis protein CheW [Leptospira andrefontaineae]
MSTFEDNQYLTFKIGEETFGIGLLNVKEILEYTHVTTVPMMPTFIPGVINLRGNVVPVLDVCDKFFRKKHSPDKRTCIVIVEVPESINGARMDIGLIVEAVYEVLSIPSSEIEPPPTFGSRIRVDFLAGMARQASGFILLLNLLRLLTVEELTALEETKEEAANVVPAG